MLRKLLWLGVLVFLLLGVVGPVTYWVVASQLPSVESELDLEKLLRFTVEGERMSHRLALGDPRALKVPFARPDLSQLPRELVTLYLAQRGCPLFLQGPKEDGPAWGLRMVAGLWGQELGGDGFCGRLLAQRLGLRIGAQGVLQVTVAAHKIHGALTKEQLVAYDLSTMYFDEGLVGVEALAEQLFLKKLSRLHLAELAEMTLILPPHNYYSQLKHCQNPTLIRQNRDQLLKQLAHDNLLPGDQVRSAVTQPVSCTLSGR